MKISNAKRVGKYIDNHRVYDNYDYESVYNASLDRLTEYEYQQALDSGKVKCLYKTKTITSNNADTGQGLKEVMIYPSFYKAKDVPRKKPNQEAQKKLNDKRARRKLARLIIINFKNGDIWATFGWNDKYLPKDREEASKQISAFIRKINRRQKKAGKENVKYIYVLAFDGYARPHFHIVLSKPVIDRDELESLWGKCDRANTRRISTEEDYILTGLANYIARNPHGTKKWVSSANLKKPTESNSYKKFSKKKAMQSAKDFEVLKANLEKAYQGYSLLDAEVTFNKVNAGFYIYARLKRN